MEKIINEIIKEKIIKIEKMGNSYSSNVYLVTLENDKYIFKVIKTKEKKEVESNALKKLNNYIDVPEFIDCGTYNNTNYIIMKYIEGINYKDDETSKLTSKDLKNIGILIKKLHSIPITYEEDNWIDYLIFRINLAYKSLNKFDFNDAIYNKLINDLNNYIKTNYNKTLVHMDFRIGNLIFNDKLYLIDFESVKVGDPVFDFIKIKRLLTQKQFDILFKNYKYEYDDFYKKLKFYNLFDSYTALEWCISNNQIDSEYYNLNLKEVKKNAKG